ncbi:hypothetical protein K9692_004664 [Escherichia coli]|nr:hypothetical protein [Escherichia coli]
MSPTVQPTVVTISFTRSHAQCRDLSASYDSEKATGAGAESVLITGIAVQVPLTPLQWQFVSATLTTSPPQSSQR